MSRHLRGYAVRSDPGSPIRFIASTADVARDGIIIDAGAWDLTQFRRNPVCLWVHDYLGQRPPIGRAVHVESSGGNLIADIEFDPNDDFARSIETKYRSGFLNAVSVGWDTKEVQPSAVAGGTPRITRAELLEISCVPVPSDPGALAIARSRYRSLRPALPAVDMAATMRGLSPTDQRRLLEAMRDGLIRTEVRLAVRDVLRSGR